MSKGCWITGFPENISIRGQYSKKGSIFVAIPRWPAIKLIIFIKMRAAVLAKSSSLASREMAATALMKTSQFDRILQY